MKNKEDKNDLPNPSTASTPDPQPPVQAAGGDAGVSATQATADHDAGTDAPDNLCQMPSTSDARREANRRNAKKSTGPKSAEGKRRSRKNAVRHGLRASTLLLETLDESAASIRAELLAEHTPQNLSEQLVLEKLLCVILRLRRQSRLEREALEHQHAFAAEGTARLIQFISLTDRQLTTAQEGWSQLVSSAREAKGESEDQTESAS